MTSPHTLDLPAAAQDRAARPRPPAAAPIRRRVALVDRDGLRDITPVLIAIVPLALVVGVTIAELPIAVGTGYLSSPLVFAGGAQMALLTLVGAGAGVLTTLASVAVVNARLMVYGAGLASRFRGQPAWFRWLAPHFLVDQTYALASARPELADRARFRRYWLTAGTVLGSVWLLVIAVGLVLGPALPEAWPLDVTAGAMFAALLGRRLTDRAAVVATLVVLAATAVTTTLPAGTSLPVSVALGVGATVAVTGRRDRS